MSPASTPFYVLRHGETDWNIENRLQGRTDIPLNARGVIQAEDAARRLEGLGIEGIVSSPLSRALVTAQKAAERLGLPITLDDRLAERSYGAFEGLAPSEVAAAIKDGRLGQQGDEVEADGRRNPPLGEPLTQVFERAVAAIDDHQRANPGKILLFALHGVTFRGITYTFIGDAMISPNASPYRIEPWAGGWRLIAIDPQRAPSLDERFRRHAGRPS